MKRLISICLMFCMLFSAALAEFAPLPEALNDAYQAGQSIRCLVKVDVNALPDVSDEALAALQKQADAFSFQIDLQTGERSAEAVTVLYDGEVMTTFGTVTEKDATDAYLAGAKYTTPAGEAHALSVVGGESDIAIPRLQAGREALWAQFDSLYQVLENAGANVKEVKASTSLENVGASGHYRGYLLQKEQMNGAWEQVLQVIFDALEALYPGQGEELVQFLRTVSFTGNAEIRRILDKEENEWGIRLLANVSVNNGPERKVTFTAAWRPEKGFLVELKAPAVDGQHPFKLMLTGAYTTSAAENKWKLEGNATYLEEGNKTTVSMTGNLRYTFGNEEKLHGKLTFTKGSSTTTLTPDFVCTADGMTGAVGIHMTENKQESDLKVHLTLAACEPLQLEAKESMSLADLEAWEKAFILRDVENSWLRELVGVLERIPAEDRALITHVLRSSAWMTGPSVPVPENGAWRQVEEEMEE